jgi:polysaccharide biosynthesis transport protein
MTFSQLIAILSARRKIILITFFSVVSVTVLYNILAPKEYTASTKVLLNTKVVDPVTGISLASQMIDSYMATQLQVLQSDSVALEVVRRLGLTNNPSIQKKFQDSNDGIGDINLWLARLLVSKLNVIFSKSNVIEITYSATDPQFAAVIANTFTDVYMEKSIRLKTEPAQKAANYLNQQVQSLRDDLTKAQQKLVNFQKENGLTSNDDRVDVESARLNEMSAQLSVAQAQLVEANSRYHDVQQNATDSPDVAQSALVQNLKMELSKAESSLASISDTVSKNHPQYISLTSQIDKLKRQLADEIAKVASNVGGTASITKERVAVLKQQVEQQKQKVLTLNQTRGEMMSLQSDVLNAQAALENANKLYGQNNIEGESGQGNIALLDTASPPFDPSKPRVLMNTFFSVLAGIFLGLLFAMIAELLNRKVRGTQDLADLIDAPVFVISNTKKSKKLLTKFTRSNKLLPSA